MLRTSVMAPLVGHVVCAQLAVAAAIAAIASFAAWVEGRVPDPRALADLALPFAAFIGGAWTAGTWRRERGDIAWANLGWRPMGVTLVLLASCVAPLAMAQGWAPPQTPRVELAIEAARVRGPSLLITWDEHGAIRHDTQERFVGFPNPSAAAVTVPNRGARIAVSLLRFALLLLLLVWLGARDERPGLTAVVAGSVVTCAVSYIGAAMLVAA